ncbi:hypothetical protein BS47DRAFT_694103 [Hydnum rufescens UP504]|uniref:Uncharacterized protein n=1 Tax=Hydnum rufescens UP504 TaxID=1448309 RepID=A0A9P6AEA5_9AGAM|nr:hypothetical protein BS47DRAFT_694103 [Hydnum rufescens UP504]
MVPSVAFYSPLPTPPPKPQPVIRMLPPLPEWPPIRPPTHMLHIPDQVQDLLSKRTKAHPHFPVSRRESLKNARPHHRILMALCPLPEQSKGHCHNKSWETYAFSTSCLVIAHSPLIPHSRSPSPDESGSYAPPAPHFSEALKGP